MADYNSAISYIQKAEGGLSNATTDTASKNPSSCTYNGQTGWHTNRGITWQTFSSMAAKAGYDATCDNFINMPDSIWLAIYKQGYWTPMGGDAYTSQAIANAVVDFAWAAGVGGATNGLKKYLTSKGITANNITDVITGLNQLTAQDGEKQAFNDLIDYRIQWFGSLNQPANIKGWTNRMETLRSQGLGIVGATAVSSALGVPIQVTLFVQKHWVATAIIGVAIVGLAIAFILPDKKK